MDWLRSEDLKEEKDVTAPLVIIAEQNPPRDLRDSVQTRERGVGRAMAFWLGLLQQALQRVTEEAWKRNSTSDKKPSFPGHGRSSRDEDSFANLVGTVLSIQQHTQLVLLASSLHVYCLSNRPYTVRSHLVIDPCI